MDSNFFNIEQKILEIVKNDKYPIPSGIVLKKIEQELNNKKLKKEVYFLIDKLLKERKLVMIKNKLVYPSNRKIVFDESKVMEGMLSINSKQSGFIALDNEKEAKYFVSYENLNNALDGDRVKFISSNEKLPKRDLLCAKIITVVERNKDYFVGVYKKDNNGYSIIVDDEKFKFQVILNDTNRLVDGNKILFKINKFEDKTAFASVVKIIGHINDVGVDILSIVYDNGITPEFDKKIIDETSNLKFKKTSEDIKIRKDLTSLPIITIDPESSKDFDDAIYVKKESNNLYKLFVCIADVSYYVQPNTELDFSSLSRGCSIYLVDGVIPMLPHVLSDDICSLNPNTERFSITCEMEIDNNGNFKNIKVYPSIIKSHRRFTYKEVNDFFDDNNLQDIDSEILESLNDARELHNILSISKKQRGYIEFDIPEPKIIIDKDGKPIDILIKKSGKAEKMIEDFMIAANEAVTIYAINKKWPFIYRVHEKPEVDKLKLFFIEAKKMGLKISNRENVTPKTINKWLEDNKLNPNFDLMNVMLLRSMSKAKYSIENVGHFGLASKNYTHFTSPIRRYSDLIIHRIFWMFDFLKEKYTNEERNQLVNELNNICKLSSEKEQVSINTERDVNDLKFAEYMEKHIGESFNATVVSVSSFGVFIELENTINGLIKLSNLKNDYYVFNKETHELIGKNTNKKFTIGTKVIAKVLESNKKTRKIEFELVEYIG